MLDIVTNEQTDALYKLIQIKGGKRVDKYQSTDIQDVLTYHKWHVKKHKEGLLMEILPQKKIYNWKDKSIDYNFQ